MYKIGLSTCGNKLNKDSVFLEYKAAGIEVAEISVPAAECEAFDFERAARLAKEAGVTLWSFHLPFSSKLPIDIADPHEGRRKRSVELDREMIRRGAAVGIKVFVIHPSAEPIEEKDRPERMRYAKESLRQLAEFAAERGCTLAVEDLPRTCLGRNSYEILELLSAHPALRCCFDTNHLLMEDAAEFVRRVGERIVTVHISDYDFLDERHWLPGEGRLNWQKILAALKEAGYCGPWLYEIGFESPRSLKRRKNLTCADFARNGRELLEGKEPTVLAGEKVPEQLIHWTERSDKKKCPN